MHLGLLGSNLLLQPLLLLQPDSLCLLASAVVGQQLLVDAALQHHPEAGLNLDDAGQVVADLRTDQEAPTVGL